MTLMEQCQIWNEQDEYQKIIYAIEALPEEERTPEMDSELARACNNLASPQDKELFKKAIDLLSPHEEYFKGQHNWNFRIAYAYYYLDQEGPALRYFKQAQNAQPGDKDTLEFIEDCQNRLMYPRFTRNFRERTADTWTAFQKKEADLRRLLDSKDQEEAGQELIAQCSEILSIAFGGISFEMGFNGTKYELILTPEGNKARLFELEYLKRHAPASLKEHWNILVGRQPSRGFTLRSFGQEISAKDVQVKIQPGEAEPGNGSRTVSLTLFCEKLLPLLQENENQVWWLLSTLTDQVLGEIPAMALIEGFDVAGDPLQESILLEELPQVLETMGLSINFDPEVYLDNSYVCYSLEPDRDPDADWRLDIYGGATRLPALVNEYLQDRTDSMDRFHEDGVVAGYFCYPLDCFSESDDRSSAILDFRDAMEAAILDQSGPDAVTFLGGATGLCCGYLDFIAWDLPAVLKSAVACFSSAPVEWANFHTFRRSVDPLWLCTPEESGSS